MLCGNKIVKVSGREIIDSRGNPTVEATVVLEDGSYGVAASPSGASTGKYEAHELRDGESTYGGTVREGVPTEGASGFGGKQRFGGKGARRAVESVNGTIAKVLCGTVCNQGMVDRAMIQADGTENKSSLGANAILAVSLAAAKAGAMHTRLPLYRYIGGVGAHRLPVPMMNILNGGAHASNSLDFQEFMVMPTGAPSFSEALRAGCEIHRALGSILSADGKGSGVGDEGGYAPSLKDESEALDYIVRAIERAGYTTADVKIALDCAASEWADGDGYLLPKRGERRTSAELVDGICRLAERYPIVSVEDALGEDDLDGWRALTDGLSHKMMLVGDDLFVTNTSRLAEGIRRGIANSVLVKPNQIGTLSETLEVIRIASRNCYRQILSHRSGETCDVSIADIAVAVNCGYIKTGAPCRGERTAKYNRLLKIEAELGISAVYSGNI